MSVKVAIVQYKEDTTEALQRAIALIGGIEDLNTSEREVTIKAGIFDHRVSHHTSVEAMQSIIAAFPYAPRINIAESDNYCGSSFERLNRCYQELFSERAIPYSLSEGPDMQKFTIAGEEMELSGALLKPRVLVDTHVLRTFEKGSILKNLFGCTPMVKKSKYHKNELFSNLLADIYCAAGGIDLAVMDGTYLYHAASDRRLRLDLLIVGRDAVAVETVGAVIAGLKPEKLPFLQEFVRRRLGEGDINNIEIVGISQEEFTALKKVHKELKKTVDTEPKRPGISSTIDCLADEGWLQEFRALDDIVQELQSRGVTNATRQMVDTTLKRRVGKTLERSKENGIWIFRRMRD